MTKFITSILLIIMSIGLLLGSITTHVIGYFQYERDIASHWALADKSPTIEIKAQHMDNFVLALENTGLQGKHNAIIMKTLNNSFDDNLKALKTLQQRLHAIELMDVTSFEYQTAIQQITSQEQGEALKMLYILKGVWWKNKAILLWNWIGVTWYLSIIILLIVGIVKLDNSWY